MQTEIIRIQSPKELPLIKPAAMAIRHGELVAFPTETVYGLGANAFKPEAVHQIFVTKGRPQDNPLIVHLSDLAALDDIARNIPSVAYPLLKSYAPGPLTVILPKNPMVPDEVTAGLDTVAVRFPSNEIARAFIDQAEVPIVAPSANSSGKPSPTRAWHVLEDMRGRIPYIIDGGACSIGLESTIVDLTSKEPEILRPGYISANDIYQKTGIKVREYQPISGEIKHPKAPGQKYRHYAPKAKVMLLELADFNELEQKLIFGIKKFIKNSQEKAGHPNDFHSRIKEQTWRIGLFVSSDFSRKIKEDQILVNLCRENSLNLEFEVAEYDPSDGAKSAAYKLFDQFRLFDQREIDLIICTAEPEVGEGIAYMNRLGKAASYRL